MLLLALVEGRLFTVGRLLVVGLLTLPLVLGRTVVLPLTVGRAEALPLALAPDTEAPALLDMLPFVALRRPSCRLWLIDPAVLLLWRTLAT